jgi:RNase P protein component
VTRNRTRRRLRAAVAEAGSELVPGGLYLFGVDRSAGTAPFTVLESSVAALVGEVRDIER